MDVNEPIMTQTEMVKKAVLCSGLSMLIMTVVKQYDLEMSQKSKICQAYLQMYELAGLNVKPEYKDYIDSILNSNNNF